MPNILVATDLSLRSERAVRRAFALARARGAALHLLSVVDDDQPERIVERRRAETREELERFCAALPDAAACDWTLHVELGDAVPVILATADRLDAELIVTGIPRRRPLVDLFGGPTVERLASQSLRPVLLVSVAAETPYASTLAGLDLSPAAAAAVRAARRLAPKARLVGFHAVHVPYAGLSAGGERNVLGAPFLHLAQADMDGWIAANGLRGTLDEARLEEGGLTVAFARMVAETRPQLVAIGAHGRGGLNPTLLGRFAAELLRDPPCDLLLVRR
ncbi:universal stress protein [Albimonas pacifica]|nr:universal stress protein [Albimonas pacifica]